MIILNLILASSLLVGEPGKNMTGVWNWHSDPNGLEEVPEESFTLHLLAKGTEIRGSACFIYNYGSRIDCPVDECNVTGTMDELGVARIVVHSEYFDTNETGTLTHEDGILSWSSKSFGPAYRESVALRRRASSPRKDLQKLCSSTRKANGH